MRQRRRKRRNRIIVIVAAAVIAAAFAILFFATDVFRAGTETVPEPSAGLNTTTAQTPQSTAAQTAAGGFSPSQTAQPTPAAEANDARTLYETALTVYANAKEPYVNGEMRITYVNHTGDTLYEVVLRLYPNAVEKGSMSVSRVAVNAMRADYSVSGDDGSILSVPLDMEIAPGESAVISFDFSIILPQTGSRFGVNTTGIMLGNALPVAAVYESGAWRKDEYTDVGDAFYSECADYKAAISAPKYYALASTGSVAQTEEADGMTTWYVAASNVREFAMALMRDPAVAQSVTEAGVKVYCYGLSQAKADFGAETAAAALDYFSQNIGLYPYETFYVVPFDQGGGMEYPGLIMVSEAAFKSAKRNDGVMIIGHETAHQWFYGVVGSDQINSPWLDESLVEFLGMDFLEEYLGASAAQEQKSARYGAAESYVRISRMDSAVYMSAGDYFHVIYVAGYQMYSKLYGLFGHDGFYAALRQYYEANAFSVATKEDLVGAFDAVTGESTGGWFEAQLAVP